MIRGEKVILDSDLAEFYGVATKRLNEQVRRNRSRFPEDFVFQLTAAEKTEVVAKCDHLRKPNLELRIETQARDLAPNRKKFELVFL